VISVQCSTCPTVPAPCLLSPLFTVDCESRSLLLEITVSCTVDPDIFDIVCKVEFKMNFVPEKFAFSSTACPGPSSLYQM